MEQDVAATQVKVGQTAAFYLEASVVNSFQCRTGEYSVSENSVDLRGPGLEQLVGGHDYGAAGVRHVVHPRWQLGPKSFDIMNHS